MNKGAFQTSREIFENPIWEDVPKFRIFFYIYGNAVFSEKGITKGNVHIKRGQFLRSYRNLREDLQYIENRSIKKYSLSMISRKIDQLVKENRLEIEETELGTLFTVVNYSIYQGLSNYKFNNENAERTEREQLENADGTEREQNENNNKNVEECSKNVKNVKNDLKESTTTGESKNDAIVFYQNNIGMIRPNIAEEMLDWINDLGDKMVIEAIKRSVDRNKPSWGYAKSILNSWSNKGIKTLDQAKAEELEFRNQRASKRGYQNNNKDIVPDWLKEQKENKKSDQKANLNNDDININEIMEKFKQEENKREGVF